MGVLNSKRREKFCQIVALEDCNVGDAAFRAGFGRDDHPTKDAYHTNMGSRLMQMEVIQNRIYEIRQENADKDKHYTNSLLNTLKRIVSFDEGKYLDSCNTQLNNGRTVTEYYLNTPIQNWDEADRALMIDGFDSQGRPKFISKTWAYDKLLKIYNLDGKSQVDIEDLMNLFTNAGLPTGNPYDGISGHSKEVNLDSDDFSKEIDEDLEED